MGTTESQPVKITDPDYAVFKENHALMQVTANYPTPKVWNFIRSPIDKGVPAVFLCSTMTTPEVYYRQFLSLPAYGVRVFSVLEPYYETYEEWVVGFSCFLDSQHIDSCHLIGTGLGGFLAQCYTRTFPKRVLSLVLINSFPSTISFVQPLGNITMTPTKQLKQNLLSNLPIGEIETGIADAVNFVIAKIDDVSRDTLVGKLLMQCTEETIEKPPIDGKYVSIMTSLDINDSSRLRSESLRQLYPGSREVFFKTGGDFPFLSRSEDFNMHFRVHLRHLQNVTNNEAENDTATNEKQTKASPKIDSAMTQLSDIKEEINKDKYSKEENDEELESSTQISNKESTLTEETLTNDNLQKEIDDSQPKEVEKEQSSYDDLKMEEEKEEVKEVISEVTIKDTQVLEEKQEQSDETINPTSEIPDEKQDAIKETTNNFEETKEDQPQQQEFEKMELSTEQVESEQKSEIPSSNSSETPEQQQQDVSSSPEAYNDDVDIQM
ncbi:putative Alpha/beta-Hydrolases superfamily protein [Monocercomonoides exilis]|uniref:putative Alpha/beta-Hydrolases superfamily protein n=1 Tax=Monocercomonoides exilis TaxID=2049356 RepID=UPI003559D422|nr:putative Alpha/beta-Hydrolases superfamily protein [Monocercomonoides exilis]|eukprot:MONOS_11096.1-p1 / transcript=MONOS_11096.1 / gene=MONOS_11096 / organism=Monocercomonoides_exilis_PA203 / gene_product=alpha / transcript_product=alpha / location=Mono_scaffold00537:36519-38139(+) / protein_length=493 / sequence_SO=supercontig / SO=protein_coding / is_pseudo=false